MGLINRQIDIVTSMVESKWSSVITREKADESNGLLALSRKWDADARVMGFVGAWESGLGEPWEEPMPAPSPYRSSWPEYSHDHRTATFKKLTENWTRYEKGEITGSLYDALRDAGYTGPKPILNYFRQTAQASMLEVALRTTRKKWDTISSLMEALSINLALATKRSDIVAAVSEMMDGLK